VQTLDGSFYGTTALGGAYNGGTVYKITPAAISLQSIVFALSLHARMETRRSQGWCRPRTEIFYGTTEGGGTYASGAVFKITPQGALTVVHSFDSYSEGVEPTSLMQSSNGTFYGSTIFGGTGLNHGSGTLFSVSPEGTYTFLYTWPCGEQNCIDGTKSQRRAGGGTERKPLWGHRGRRP